MRWVAKAAEWGIYATVLVATVLISWWVQDLIWH